MGSKRAILINAIHRQIGRVRRGRKGFTLIELLAAISIIGLLIALLLPAMAKTRIRAFQTACAANIRRRAQGCFEYAQTKQDQYPMDFQANRLAGGLGTYRGLTGNVGAAWGVSAQYTDGILTDPISIDCPDLPPAISDVNSAATIFTMPAAGLVPISVTTTVCFVEAACGFKAGLSAICSAGFLPLKGESALLYDGDHSAFSINGRDMHTD